MIRGGFMCVCAAVPVLAAVAFAAAEDARSGWLNARECGASGSKFETTASTTAGSNKIVVKDVGDFKVGQGVMVSKCNIRYVDAKLWGPRGRRGRPQPLGDVVEMRGYDGSSGSWTVFILDVDGEDPPTFRWSDDLARTWKESKVPIDGKWHPLSGKTEVRFGKLDWGKGYIVTFSARDQLVSTIEKIEGNVLTLKDPANRTVTDAVVRHSDRAALQAAVDRAIKEKRNLFVPVGWYRLTGTVTVKDADAIIIEGESAEHTVLDISEGVGACFRLENGTEVTLRNFRFIGHSGYDRRDQCGALRTLGWQQLWGFYLKHCNAVSIANTERVLVENCHATKMSAECFYCQGRCRTGTREPRQYTKAVTYLRCSVVDSGRNAFNNNDMAENTSVLYCRIVDVGGCSWEGASRFVKFIGNYVRNGGTVAMGNIGSRAAHFEELPSGQHIVADNVFESGVCYGSAAVRTCHGAVQVIIRNNLFINYGTSAIDVSGLGDARHLPSAFTTVSGNIMDMTSLEEEPKRRTAISVSADNTIVSDNQIYVRGGCDPNVTAIELREPAVNVNIHDNMIYGCGTGLLGGRGKTSVAEVIDPVTFTALGRLVPLPRPWSHCYRGWNLAWLKGGKPSALSRIEVFDAEKLQFKLAKPEEIKPGDTFEVFAPDANWTIHDNTITGCQRPVVLDCYGSPSSVLSGNLISRGSAEGVEQAIELHGRFNLIDNHISGFDEANSAALFLNPDPLGRACVNVYRGNVFENCSTVVKESRPGLWKASKREGNIYQECKTSPKTEKKDER